MGAEGTGMSVIEVVFDGKAFVPTAPVDLPAGTRAEVTCPGHGYPGPPAGAPAGLLTAEQERVWREFMRAARAAVPDPPTFDEYLREQRGVP
jgi:hypothetical protein